MTKKAHVDKRLIKRYGNRKLYDVTKSRYITLDGIRTLVQSGEDVQVVDNRSGEDLTGITFAQIIYEAEKRRTGALALPLLRRMIEIGDETVQRSREAIESVVDAAEKGVRKLVGGEGTHFLEDVLDLPQRRLEEIQTANRSSSAPIGRESHPQSGPADRAATRREQPAPTRSQARRAHRLQPGACRGQENADEVQTHHNKKTQGRPQEEAGR